jgi:hypothetical protein
MQTPEDFIYALAGCDMPEAIEADFLAELARLEAESIGWIPLEDGAYLHVSDLNVTEVLVVGVPQAGVAVLLVG